MELLETLIAQGLDPGQFHAPQFEQWPCPCSPDWIAEHWTNDPFFLEYVGILAAPYDGKSVSRWKPSSHGL